MTNARAVVVAAGCESSRTESWGGQQLVSRSPAMREVRDLVDRIAQTEIAVLLSGEPGAGKEAVAWAIHAQSLRNGGPFVYVDCEATLDEEFADRWLARGRCDVDGNGTAPRGLLECAQGGTLFLAHVERLPHWAQVRLFDSFQHDLLYGATSPGPRLLNVRLIASTTSDLEQAVADRAFYPSLYHFLSAAVIRVPPLRERSQDIAPLAEHYLSRSYDRLGITARRARCRFTEKAQNRLLGYAWPGNLPELASVVARAALLASGKEIDEQAIVYSRRTRSAAPEMISVPLAGNLRTMEQHVIREVVRRCQGNKAAAARQLGLHRRTLYRMLDGADPRAT